MASSGVKDAVNIIRKGPRRRTPIRPSGQFLPIIDWISPTPSHLLSVTLGAHLKSVLPGRGNHFPRDEGAIPHGHHLVYFPTPTPEQLLLPDGSDGNQSPDQHGLPRRMWASGTIQFLGGLRYHNSYRLYENLLQQHELNGKVYRYFRRRIFDDKKNNLALDELRCLVFLPPRPPGEVAAAAKHIPVRDKAEFEHIFTPTTHTLMRFSALTFNAHRIHYDRGYAEGQEGYPGLLCHGPFAVVVMLEAVRAMLPGTNRIIREFDYKCIAPMYVDRPYKVAGCRNGEDKWKVWVETPEGGYAVRGTVRTKLVGEDTETTEPVGNVTSELDVKQEESEGFMDDVDEVNDHLDEGKSQR